MDYWFEQWAMQAPSVSRYIGGKLKMDFKIKTTISSSYYLALEESKI